MPTGRTALLALATSVVALACAAAAAAGVPERIIFPVVGPVTYQDDYGDPRWQGSHQGNDLMGRRFQYAVAAEAGRVEKRKRGGYSCYLFLRGKSGTHYWYIHLNNDLRGAPRNDNQGGCRNGISWPKGLKQGQWVRAGQPIGYVGDSGDANGIQPHLHFEIRRNGVRPINPFRYLNRARRLIYTAPAWEDSVRLRIRAVVRGTSPRLLVRTVMVRSLPGRFFRVSKLVAIDVPEDAVVERKTRNGKVRRATLGSAESGDRVFVWTKSSAPTLATKRGRPGAWDAERIRLLAG